MSTASEKTIGVLEEVVQSVGVGTNLAMLHLAWAIISGAFLGSRGGLFPALKGAGFSDEQTRRAAQALRSGVWQLTRLLAAFRAVVAREGQWQPRRYEGYRPVAADVTVFWRPTLQRRVGRFFHHLAGRAVNGVGVGLVVQVGQVGTVRLPLLKQLIHPPEGDRTDQGLQQQVLTEAAARLEDDEVLIYDAGASVAELQAAGVARYVVRLARNATARRNTLPATEAGAGRGRPRQYGERVRPLARTYKDRRLPATPPDVRRTFVFASRQIEACGWLNLVGADQKADPQQATFTIWAFTDPLYRAPLLVATNLAASAETIFACYHDRWPVEQLPLVAKQLVGLGRQFVFAPASCQRLPELALFLGNVLTYLAAVLPPLPTGFWDRTPQPSPGRLRRHLAQEGFSTSGRSAPTLRKKAAVTDHLPKGVAAHRRRKAA